MWRILLVASATLLSYTQDVSGHGFLREPPNRSSLWRKPDAYPDAHINYNDNQNFCGGFDVQWGKYEGRCGLCGDSFGEPTPRANELGGSYDIGVIPRTYHEGSHIPTKVDITAAHLGFFEFSMCNLDEGLGESEECFAKYPVSLLTGEPVFNITKELNKAMQHHIYLSLPEGLVCEHCVLRWHYQAGNNWGVCADGTQGMGCGPQENFVTCSDIAIRPKN